MNAGGRVRSTFTPAALVRRLWHGVRAHALQLAMLLSLPSALMVVAATSMSAQSVIVDGPPGPVLPNITPRFTIRVVGLPVTTRRPLVYTLLISRSPAVEGSFVETRVVSSNDTIVDVIVSRLLPNGTPSNPITIYWKALVAIPDGQTYQSVITGPRRVPLWLTLLQPNAGTYDTRRPEFVWQSAKIDPQFGAWSYDIQIFTSPQGRVVQSGQTNDTTFVPPLELEANQNYKWLVTAVVNSTRDVVTDTSSSSFSINDPSVPTTTLLYQNFPNPFPTAQSFATCFWFDVKVGGARVSLDILDLRGSLVKRIITSRDLQAGIYGRGAAGSGSNCDLQFVWNGTDIHGLTVPAGIYLARFVATGSPPLTKKIVFNGR